MKTYTVQLTVMGTKEYTIEAKSEEAAQEAAAAKFWEGLDAPNPADCSLLNMFDLEVTWSEATEED